jgi:hypothetical protein
VYDNSVRPLPVLVASGRGRETTHVAMPPTWEGIYREHPMRATRGSKDIDRIFVEGVLVDRAVRDAVREAIRQHRQARQPMAVWEDGKVVWVDAAELEAEVDAAGDGEPQ